jgi:hypothetical protein
MLGTLAVTAAAAPAQKSGRPGRFMFPPTVTVAEAIAEVTGADGVLRFEIAEDGTRSVWDNEPAHADGLPTHGTSYLSYGYIYPVGTLVNGADGVNANGSPEFPDKVLGLWASYGWYVGSGAHATTDPSTLSSQLFNFGDGWGDASLVTEGYLLADVDVQIARAVTGGTGPYAGLRGEVLATNLGRNETAGGNASYEVHLAQ